MEGHPSLSICVLREEIGHKPGTTNDFLTQGLSTSSMAGRVTSLATSGLVSITGRGRGRGTGREEVESGEVGFWAMAPTQPHGALRGATGEGTALSPMQGSRLPSVSNI